MTTTEYVLIAVAIAVVVYGTYLALGSNVRSLVSGEDSSLITGYRAGRRRRRRHPSHRGPARPSIPMPDRTVKRRLQDCDAALASDDGPIFSTVAKLVEALSAPFPKERKTRS